MLPAVDLDDQDDPRRPTTITVIPGAIRGDGQNAQPKPIPPGATVTVTFNKAAGISNPTEGGAFSWEVATSKSTKPEPAQHPDQEVRKAFSPALGEAANTGLLVDWEIQLSHEKVHRGEEVTVIGRGYKNGTTLTFWRDENFDGVRDRDEEMLCQVNVEKNDIGYCTFTVNKPPFDGIFGECKTVAVDNGTNDDSEETDPRKAAEGADCNFINGVDGLNHTSIWVREKDKGEPYRLDDLPQVLELEGYLAAEVGASRRLSVQMQDFPGGRTDGPGHRRRGH